jgi:hypothetical protein
VQKEVMPLLIPVLKTQFAVYKVLKKDKAKSTAFLVAQIFPVSLPKIPTRRVREDLSCRK